MPLTARLKTWLGPRWTTRARCVLRGLPIPWWGNLRRTHPFSSYFGFERGTPVDRYYLAHFLDAHRADITGDVLEVQVGDITRRYGHQVRRSDTIDIEPQFHPTWCCDLATADTIIPDDHYDCFILPNTLSFLRDLDACLRQALRVVRPGGVVLGTTAVLGQMNGDGKDYWHLSAEGWQVVAERVWPGCNVTVRAYGNCLSATAAVMGLATEELTTAELDVMDPKFPVLVGICCRKPVA